MAESDVVIENIHFSDGLLALGATTSPSDMDSGRRPRRKSK
ncbi:MAG: hypothetical protein ACLTSG_14235 [Lachnospiraceae bacterium]